MQNTIKINLWTDVAYLQCYVAHNSFEIAKKIFLKNNPDKKIELIIHNYMIDQNTKKTGEDYLEYNKRRWEVTVGHMI